MSNMETMENQAADGITRPVLDYLYATFLNIVHYYEQYITSQAQ